MAAVVAWGLATDVAAQRYKTTCGADTPVTVSITGGYGFTGADDLGYALVSDGQGPYLNAGKGSDKITAIFQVNNCTHDFTMNLNFSRRSMWALLVDPVDGPFVRRANFFNFDRVASVPVTTTANFLTSPFCQYGWLRNADGSVATNAADPYNPVTYRDNYEGCGNDSFGNYVLRGGSMSLDGDERLGFAMSPLDIQSYPCPDGSDPSCQTDYIRVYHPNANTWILRPNGGAAAAYRVWASGAYLFEGFQSVPFEITVTRP